MPKIFALQGRGNCGKTSTLKEVFSQLTAKYPSAVVSIIKQNTDIKVIIEINGIKVGIESQGDPNSRLINSLPYFVAKGCDIIFCAVRTTGMTVDWVNQYSSTHVIKFVLKTIVSTSHATTNKSQATSLINLAGL